MTNKISFKKIDSRNTAIVVNGSKVGMMIINRVEIVDARWNFKEVNEYKIEMEINGISIKPSPAHTLAKAKARIEFHVEKILNNA